jgi:hypothetical protein
MSETYDGLLAQGPQDKARIRGFFRVQLEEDGKVVGDSGWRENQVTNLGFNQYLVSSLGSIAGSKYVSHMAVGTGGAPAASATTLSGESEDSATARAAVTAATSSSSKTVRFTATFSSANSFLTQTRNLSNIGLFNTSAVTTGTLFAGNTYTSSAVATNQNVNATYDIIFS